MQALLTSCLDDSHPQQGPAWARPALCLTEGSARGCSEALLAQQSLDTLVDFSTDTCLLALLWAPQTTLWVSSGREVPDTALDPPDRPPGRTFELEMVIRCLQSPWGPLKCRPHPCLHVHPLTVHSACLCILPQSLPGQQVLCSQFHTIYSWLHPQHPEHCRCLVKKGFLKQNTGLLTQEEGIAESRPVSDSSGGPHREPWDPSSPHTPAHDILEHRATTTHS